MTAATGSSAVGGPLRCTQCAAPLESPIGCRECHAVFPSQSPIDHFARLGLPRSFDLDRGQLENRFLAWSRELHPDYFSDKPAAEQSLSLDLSAKLNDAYATLKDPFRRAEYLLQLLGGPSAAERRQMPEDFLERVLELRMEIEAAKDVGGAALAELEARIGEERQSAMANVAMLFAEVEPNDVQRFDALRAELNAIKYLDGLLRDLDA